MTARIFRPAKSATQSGSARMNHWVLEFEPETPREIEPLMGWTSSSDMKSQVRLSFDTKEEALAYAARNGIEARVFNAREGELLGPFPSPDGACYEFFCVNAKHPAMLDADTAAEVRRLLREEWLMARAQELVIQACPTR